MEQKHKDIIRRNYSALASAINTQIQVVAKDLLNKNVFSERMYQEIVEAPTTSLGRAEALLDKIPLRGPNAFEELYKTIMKCELYAAANILKPNKDHWREV